MYDEIKFGYLKAHPLFTDLGSREILKTSSIVKMKNVHKGETLHYGEGEHSRIFLLVTGKIKIIETDEAGSDFIKDLLAAPDVFGDLGLNANASFSEFAAPLVANTVACMAYTSDFRKLLQEDPTMWLNYVAIMNNRLKRMESRHSNLVRRDARERLIAFIRDWARSDGNRIGDKIVLKNYLTHTDIARMIAVSRQNVNSFLNELRNLGLLFYDREKIELTDPSTWN